MAFFRPEDNIKFTNTFLTPADGNLRLFARYPIINAIK